MKYNLEYINIKYALMSVFLTNADKNIVDISYNTDNTEITIQIVLLNENVISYETKKKLIDNLSEYNIKIIELHITREHFNETKGEWIPKHYIWLENVLFCKAEVL